ncbi:MAG: hypothetical protein JXR40_05250 [Pontiellaceae bacterium]|nr:hypothetical protein [Pontiellaceae bacterium]
MRKIADSARSPLESCSVKLDTPPYADGTIIKNNGGAGRVSLNGALSYF